MSVAPPERTSHADRSAPGQASQPRGGQPLDATTRAPLEARLGQDLSGVRIHADATSAAASRSVGATAFTVGEHVHFAPGAFSPGTAGGQRLIAHEVAHVVQHSRATSAPSKQVSSSSDDAEREARLVADGATNSVRAVPTARVLRQEPSVSPERLSIELESDSAETRATALTALSTQPGPAAWTVLLRAQLSKYADVRAGADKHFRNWARTQPDFLAFLRQQANIPRGLTTDLAVMLLQSLDKPGTANPDDYRNVIQQRLDLAHSWLDGLAKDFEDARQRIQPDFTQPQPVSPAGAPFAPTALVSEIEALQKDLKDAQPDDLVRLGVRSSLLIERLSLVRTTIAGIKEQTAQIKQPGALKEFLDTRITTLLSTAGRITSETEDPATKEVAEEIVRWPADLTGMLAEQLENQFTDARKQIAAAITDKPLPSFKKAWQNFRTTLLEPILPEVDNLILRAGRVRTLARSDTEKALSELQALGPDVEEVGSRVQAVLAAVDMEATYKDLALTDDAAKDILANTEWTIKQFFAAFATLAADRTLTTEQRQKALEQLVSSPEFAAMQKDVANWHEILAGELRFAMLLAEIAILVLSAYSGGLAGGLMRGLLGRGASLAGRLAIGAAVVGAEATAFTVTSRVLHMPFGGKFYDDKFLTELGLNALLFGLMRGSGAVYERFVTPNVSKGLAAVGKGTLTFTLFQGWAVGLHRWETGEWIGLGDARFWKLAAQNVILLGALHIGMGIVRPLMAPLEQKVVQLTVDRHNARCSALGRSIEAWKASENPSTEGALDIVRRSRALYLERLEILRAIHQSNPKDFSADELKEAEAVLRGQVSAAEEVLFQGRARMVAHESDPNTFYYEGDAAAIRAHYESRGYKSVEFDPATGRMRLRDPTGKEIDLIRSTFGTTGAGRRPTAAEAEVLYDTIRKGTGDTSAISVNTGIPNGVLRIIRQHVFFKEHLIFDPAEGKQVRRRFTADEDIAQLWTAASRGKLDTEDLARFRRLMAHEYVEAMLVRGGMQYQDPRAWVQDPDGTWTYRPGPEHFGAHDLAPRTDPNLQAFGHYEALKLPMKNVAKLPLKAWMGIPPEDLIHIDNPALTAVLARLSTTLGTDLIRKLIVVAAQGGGDPSLTGTLNRLADLPGPEAIRQAEALVAGLGAKPGVPAIVERGEPFKRGGTAQLYGMKDHPELLVKPAGGRLSKEAQALVDLESLGIPTPYIATKTVEGEPSIIMQKIDGEGSKDIIGRVSSLRKLKDAEHTDLVTQKTVDDLHRIYDILVKSSVNIGDFQFIVRRSDGSVFVNDPTGLTFNSKPSAKVRMIIERFEAILKAKEGGTP